MDERKGQVTIFVVLAVILLASIILFFVLTRDADTEVPGQGETVFEPSSFIETCAKDSVIEATNIMLPQGGFISPQNPRNFDGKPVEYICENAGFYNPCIQQHPVLIQEMKQEIKNYISPRIEDCFSEMETEFERRNAGVIFINGLSPQIDVSFAQDLIKLNIKQSLKIEKSEETQTFEEFNIDIKSPAYNLAIIAMEIAAQQARYCYFEYVGYNIIYNRYKVEPFALSDPTRIYTITDKDSGQFMRIAIRSCAIPAGI